MSVANAIWTVVRPLDLLMLPNERELVDLVAQLSRQVQKPRLASLNGFRNLQFELFFRGAFLRGSGSLRLWCSSFLGFALRRHCCCRHYEVETSKPNANVFQREVVEGNRRTG